MSDTADRFARREFFAVRRCGGRSAMTAETLARTGIEVGNLAGGMTAWPAAG